MTHDQLHRGMVYAVITKSMAQNRLSIAGEEKGKA